LTSQTGVSSVGGHVHQEPATAEIFFRQRPVPDPLLLKNT